jgi:hypothetical protein
LQAFPHTHANRESQTETGGGSSPDFVKSTLIIRFENSCIQPAHLQNTKCNEFDNVVAYYTFELVYERDRQTDAHVK